MRCLSSSRQVHYICLSFPGCRIARQKQRQFRGPSPRTCAATSEQDRETASTESKPEVESRKERSAQGASTSDDAASAEELRQLANTRRQKSREDNMGLIEGILDETRRISWPTPGQALKDTFVVVGIVVLSAVVLFGLNSTLSEGSRLLYDKLGR